LSPAFHRSTRLAFFKSRQGGGRLPCETEETAPPQGKIKLRRDQEFHQFRRNRFDDGAGDARPRGFGTRPRLSDARSEAQAGPPTAASVKWFNAEKGFGFVTLADGSGDAFLHGSVLARSGIGAVAAGDTVTVRIAPGQKGPQVTEVLSVDAAPAGGGADGGAVSGTVSWFDAEKGFGFITRDDGRKDVFVHISALERSGLAGLSGGQRVLVDVGEGRKGPEATRLRLA
jgi:cold shock protein